MKSAISIKLGQLGLILMVFVGGVLIGFSASGVIAQGPPPTATPIARPVPGNRPPIDYQSLIGNGVDHAPLALQASLAQLPFRARLPGYLPSGMQHVHSTAQLIGADRKYGNLDLYYVSPEVSLERINVHIYQTNQSIEVKPSAQIGEVKTIKLGSEVWVYQLLAFPQPNGSTFNLHNLRHRFEDSVYVDLDMSIGASPDATLGELMKVAQSLR